MCTAPAPISCTGHPGQWHELSQYPHLYLEETRPRTGRRWSPTVALLTSVCRPRPGQRGSRPATARRRQSQTSSTAPVLGNLQITRGGAKIDRPRLVRARRMHRKTIRPLRADGENAWGIDFTRVRRITADLAVGGLQCQEGFRVGLDVGGGNRQRGQLSHVVYKQTRCVGEWKRALPLSQPSLGPTHGLPAVAVVLTEPQRNTELGKTAGRLKWSVLRLQTAHRCAVLCRMKRLLSFSAPTAVPRPVRSTAHRASNVGCSRETAWARPPMAYFIPPGVGKRSFRTMTH